MSISADFDSFKTHFTSKFGTNGYFDLKAVLLEEDLESLLNDETFEHSVAKRLLLKGSLRNDGFFGAKGINAEILIVYCRRIIENTPSSKLFCTNFCSKRSFKGICVVFAY